MKVISGLKKNQPVGINPIVTQVDYEKKCKLYKFIAYACILLSLVLNTIVLFR